MHALVAEDDTVELFAQFERGDLRDDGHGDEVPVTFARGRGIDGGDPNSKRNLITHKTQPGLGGGKAWAGAHGGVEQAGDQRL